MKVSYKEFKTIIPKLKWGPEELSSKLSIIGHEAEVLTKDLIDVKLTTNRKDCQDINYLAFDLVAFYGELGSNTNLIKYKQGKPVKITLDKINKILGSNVSRDDYMKIERLGFIVKDNVVIPPDFRVDVFEGADIAEEVFRMVGSDAVEIKPLSKIDVVESREFEFLNNLRATLADAGASETRTISFTRAGKTKLKNPFSTAQPFMRDSLLYGLLETVSKNPYLRRNYFYEIGDIFRPKEATRLGIILTGYKKPEELVSSLEKKLGLNIRFTKVEEELLEQFSVKQPNAMFAQLDVNDIKSDNLTAYKSAGMPAYKKISKFPPLVRDISITTSSIEEIIDLFDNLLISEQIDSYTNPKSDITTDTYRLIFQNTESSFSQKQIKEIDNKLAKFI